MEQRTSAPNRALLNNGQLWTRVNFEVQLGFKITADEIPFLPRATVDVDGNPAIPETDGEGDDAPVVIRRVTMSFPPHQASTLVLRSPRDGDEPELVRRATATMRAAFMRAVKQARRDGHTEFFVNLGVKAKRTTLIENTLPTKEALAGPPAPARLTS